MGIFKDKALVLAVTGGIAAYKSAELARLFIKEGAKVRVVMTASACRFITPLTFQSLTRNPVATDLWESGSPYDINHISLADWADGVVIAPATANIIGKIAGGIADDFLSTFIMAVKAPVIICPAMNVNMYNNAIVQGNLEKLRSGGYRIVEPGSGELACGTEGQGRLPELSDIVEETRKALTNQDLVGLKIMVSSGPAREKWDDVRFISNRSSGKMGTALAAAAYRRGARVTLVTGPTALAEPYGVVTVNTEGTLDMKQAIEDRFSDIDVLIMAAAPGDFRPANQVSGKVKKGELPPPIELALLPDILMGLGPKKGDKILVGFAAEAVNLIENAKKKLTAKNLDLIVANQIGQPGAAFGADTNLVSIIDPSGAVNELPMLSKDDVADAILDRVVRLVEARGK